MKIGLSFLVGLLFSLGLGVSGMTQPEKVVAFLDLFRNWDPSLIFVMVGAITVHAISYRFIVKRPSPILVEQFHLPTRKDIDLRLLLGATLFGSGWGLGGFCPGPGLVSLASGHRSSLVFVGAMVLGMLVFYVLKPLINKILP